MHFNEIYRDVHWTDISQRYEDVRINSSGIESVHLDNAFIDVALTYRQFDVGWNVYENMKRLNKHTPIKMMNLCWKAFMMLKKSTTSDLGELMNWEARAWAVYHRAQSMDSRIKPFFSGYLRQRMMEIVRESPQVESRPTKMSALQGK